MKAIMVRIGDEWFRGGDGWAQNQDSSRLQTRIDAVKASAEWKSLGGLLLYGWLTWSNSLQKYRLTFGFGGTCYPYSNDAGVGSVVESWC